MNAILSNNLRLTIKDEQHTAFNSITTQGADACGMKLISEGGMVKMVL